MFDTRKRTPFSPLFSAHSNHLFFNKLLNVLQEERKVEVLSAKLAELGVDAAALLAAATSEEKKTTPGDDLT